MINDENVEIIDFSDLLKTFIPIECVLFSNAQQEFIIVLNTKEDKSIVVKVSEKIIFHSKDYITEITDLLMYNPIYVKYLKNGRIRLILGLKPPKSLNTIRLDFVQINNLITDLILENTTLYLLGKEKLVVCYEFNYAYSESMEPYFFAIGYKSAGDNEKEIVFKIYIDMGYDIQNFDFEESLQKETKWRIFYKKKSSMIEGCFTSFRNQIGKIALANFSPALRGL